MTATEPTKQIPSNSIANLFTLWYRQGQNPHPQVLNFHFSGDQRQATERAKRHCEIMNYRFIWLRPFVTDLDKTENFLLHRDGEA